MLDCYEADQRRRGLSEGGIRRRRYALDAFARHVAPESICKATPAQVEEWLDSRKVSPRTRSWLISALSAFYRWAVREELLKTNPCDRVAKPRLPRLLPRPITQADLTLALGAADARMRAWLLLAAYEGLRAKEIAGLRREDVMEDQGILLVSSGKGGHQRALPLHPDVYAALKLAGLPDAGWLFVGQRGPLKPGTVTKYVSRFLHGLGISATAHRGRHYFATEVYKASGDLRLTQELMGHSHPGTTAIYAAWDQSVAKGVVESLGKSAL